MSALDPLKCGECRGDAFRIYADPTKGEGRFGGEGSAGWQGSLVTHCLGCGSRSTITIARPGFVSEGTICGGWKKEKK